MCLATKLTPKCHFVSKFSKLGLPWFWRFIILCADLQLRWGWRQSCSPHWELSKIMWHATYMQGNYGDSWLLVVGSQIGNSFGHNLCCKYPNGSCKPIVEIYVSRFFQWYKELFNPMKFDLWNCPLKIWEPIGTPAPKVGAHLGVCGFIPLVSYIPGSMKCDSRVSLLACTFASPRFGHEPKAKVATIKFLNPIFNIC